MGAFPMSIALHRFLSNRDIDQINVLLSSE